MNESLGPPGLQPYSAPSLPSPPSGLEEHVARDYARELRKRLLSACADLKTTDERRDWLLHMTMQVHHLPTLIELIDEFNQSQLSGLEQGFEFIEVGFHDLGLLFRRRTPFSL